MSAHPYLPVLGALDAWHADARARHPGVIPCRPGCSACCRGPFDISVADAELVGEGLGALDPAAREDIRMRAALQAALMRRVEPALGPPWDLAPLGDARVDALVEALADDPCPCLDDAGRCRIYSHRPMVCRLIGLPLATARGAVIENACPVQEEHPAYRALPPQPFPLEAWEEDEEAAKVEAALRLFGSARRAGFETTVAGAVLLADLPRPLPA